MILVVKSVCGRSKVSSDDWQDLVKGLLKAELKKRNLGYKELAEKLAELGVTESERNIANKISRGGFTAVFFLQCLKAIGCHTLRLDDL
jgi:Domain of unknown function (DUF6471)